MKKLKIKLHGKKYFVNIGYKIINDANIISYLKLFKDVVLITNSTLHKIYKKNIIDNFMKLKVINNKIILNDGEIYKNFNSIKIIIDKLVKFNCGRKVLLIAFGGGVIGDITGFAASIYKRGVKYINIPTTLLSQVDASIGGKTGINSILSKNIIGTFYHPECVIIDLIFLKTLRKQDFISGLSEIIKYAILFDKKFFYWIKNNFKKIFLLDKKTLLYCIMKSCKFKIKIIVKDEREKDCRMFLNLGHTFGHAIESFTKYTWLHGEAVSAGIVMSSYYSKFLGKISHKEIDEIVNLFSIIGLPINGPKNMKFQDYLKYMVRDKKNVSNKKIRLIIPEKIGKCILIKNAKIDVLRQTINKNLKN
ncbi:3-dehydroquinate synthase [Buchnera aphidicola (Astegopteryx bambusae)]|uniref:3-dehydroquinate synthase n=1 Tax=Buchnera aphidicola TaxID=9 RepID=UPI0031B8B100